MAAGYFDFTAGGVLSAANLEDYCETQSIMRFATTAARDAALVTIKTKGMTCYVTATDEFYVYDGVSAWQAFSSRYASAAGTPWHDWSTANGEQSSIAAAIYSSGGGMNWGAATSVGRVRASVDSIHAKLRIAAGAGVAANAGTITLNLPRACKFVAGLPMHVGTGFWTHSNLSVFVPFFIVPTDALGAVFQYPSTHNGPLVQVTSTAPFAFTGGGAVCSIDLDYEPA